MRLALVSLLVLACGGAPAKPAITDRDWSLVAIGERLHTVGMDGKPITLRLDSASSRASGFAGCNQYSGAYTLAGDKLTFGPTMSTKMFCEPSQRLEDAYLGALGLVSTWELAGDTLVLRSPGMPEMRFFPLAAK